jgi:hypothetical protein
MSPFELMNPEIYNYGQTCRIPKLMNEVIMKRNLSPIRSCYEHVLAHHPVEEVNLPVIIIVTEGKIDVAAAGTNAPMSALTTELRSCVSEAIAKIPAPTQEIEEIGGQLPWILKGIMRFGIGQ